jgi:hypothetical protein
MVNQSVSTFPRKSSEIREGGTAVSGKEERSFHEQGKELWGGVAPYEEITNAEFLRAV